MRTWIAFGVAVVVACGRRAPAPPSNTATATPTPQLSDEDALVALVLERYLAESDTMPDANLLPDTGPIDVRSEAGAHRIDPVAFPSGGREFRARTAAELQQQAETSRRQVGYIAFGWIRVTGMTANVSYGVDIAIPADPNTIKMCCCSAAVAFVKREGRWMVDPGANRVVQCH